MKKFYCFTFLMTIFAFSCGTPAATQSVAVQPIEYTNPLPHVYANGQVTSADGKTTQTIDSFNSPTTSVFFIVRHAEKDGIMSADSADLNAIGWGRAGALTKILRDIRLTNIFSTNISHGQSTAKPLHLAKHIDIQTYEKEQYRAMLNGFLVKNKGQKVFIVGHSNTVPEMLNFLTSSNDYQLIADDDYANFYIVTVTGNGRSKVWNFRF